MPITTSSYISRRLITLRTQTRAVLADLGGFEILLTYPGGVFSGEIFGKGRSVGRLVTMSAVGGVLVAAIMVPAVGSIGVAVRNAANKFDTLSTSVLGK